LGDDLYCHEPFCEALLRESFHFILVCRPDSHQTLYEHLDGIALPTVVCKRWTGKTEEIYTYRYLNQVPLRDNDDALLVNWCEITVTRADGKQLYKNALPQTTGSPTKPWQRLCNRGAPGGRWKTKTTTR
jgi:hypothetical protein